MIYFFIGTKAQFIKMAPIMVELKNRGVKYGYVDSGQHADLTKKLRTTFGIAEPDVCFRKSGDVTSIIGGLLWSLKLVLLSFMPKKWLREKIFPSGHICLIHGDTMSTLLGMRMARAAGVKVGHVEAGLRSFCIWHPFPEELIRIICMRRCELLFAPSTLAESNLKSMKKVSGRIIGVQGNTVVDSLRLMKDVETTVEIPRDDFALVACHRLETITSKKRLGQVVDLLNMISEKIKIIFVTHKPTRKYLKRFGLLEKLSGEITVLGMQDYMNFTALLKSAKMVLADGGSIQEECSYLNKQCLILRNKTERPDGLGTNAVLWEFNDSIAKQFLAKNENSGSVDLNQWPSPSKHIVDALLQAENKAMEQH